MDYYETFTSIAKLNTVRVLLSIVINLDWTVQQLNIKNTILKGDLEENVFMDSPLGFDGNYSSNVCKLKKSLYNLKQ